MILNYLDFMGSSKKNLKKLDSVKEDSLYHRSHHNVSFI